MPDGSWHFDRSLSIGTIIAIISVVLGIGGPILLWGRAIEARTQAIELRQESLAKDAAEKWAEDRERQKEFLSRLDKFSDQVVALRLTLASKTK